MAGPMRVPRALLAVAAVATVAAVAWLLLGNAPEGQDGRYAIGITGPEGPVWNGTVTAAGTPLAVLRAAGAAGGFAVDVEGRGCQAYVRAIDGHAARGDAGWLFEVHDDPDGDGERSWRHPLRSAGCVPLAPGDAVRWTWSKDAVY